MQCTILLLTVVRVEYYILDSNTIFWYFGTLSFLLIYLFLKYNLHLYFEYKAPSVLRLLPPLPVPLTWNIKQKNVFAGPIKYLKDIGMSGIYLFFIWFYRALPPFLFLVFPKWSRSELVINYALSLLWPTASLYLDRVSVINSESLPHIIFQLTDDSFMIYWKRKCTLSHLSISPRHLTSALSM